MTSPVHAGRRFAAAVALFALLGCGPVDPEGVEIALSADAIAHFGDPCLSRVGVIADRAEIEAASWAVGCSLRLGWGWLRPCGGWFGEPCEPLRLERVRLEHSDAWQGEEVGFEGGLRLRAVGPGSGRVTFMANDRSFEPVTLRAVEGTSVAVTSGWNADQGTSAPLVVDTIRLEPGSRQTVVVTLSDAGGRHLCGPVAMISSIADPLVTIEVDALAGSHTTNFPIHLVAGSTAGATRATFTVGALAAEIDLVVSGQ